MFSKSKLVRCDYEALTRSNKIRTIHLHTTKYRGEYSVQQISVTKGRYQALSYIQGSKETPFKAIILDANKRELSYIPPTENLQLALYNLRDTLEITNKVAMMGDIYRNASMVVTYVGPAVPDKKEEQAGIRLLQPLDKHFEPNYGFIYGNGSLRNIIQTISQLPVQEIPEDLQVSGEESEEDVSRHVKQSWRWLYQVANDKWMQRLWIVQEQPLLNRQIIMLHGPSILFWDAVAAMNILFHFSTLPSRYQELELHCQTTSRPH
ncbi:hypothetical protein V8E51_006432 [Hyaloscypha variabilis]